jgi:hypothetical protein
MKEESDPNTTKKDAKNEDNNSEQENVQYGVSSALQQRDPHKNEQQTRRRPRPSFPVWFLHFLWRRRKWSKIRKIGHPGPNWAEKTTIIVTVGIFLVACTQAYIYWRQANIMQLSLQQNERSIILGQGQLAVTGRNANTAATALDENKQQFSNTLAQIKEQTKAQQKAANASLDQVNAFKAGERALMSVEAQQVDVTKLKFIVKNVGHSSALNVAIENCREERIPAPSQTPSPAQLEPYLVQIPPDDNGTVYTPAEEHPFECNVPDKRELLDEANKGITLIVFTRVGYKDIFGRIDHSSACMNLRTARAGTFVYFRECPSVSQTTKK